MYLDKILELLIENEEASIDRINMVPSENYASALSRIPMIFDTYNRYFFNATKEEKNWSFRGVQSVCEIETDIAIPLLMELTNSKYVNVRPISGLSAMGLVLQSLGHGKSSKILTVSHDMGGHYATKSLAEKYGLEVDFIDGIDEHKIDLEKLENQVKQNNYSLVYIDQSNCLFPISVSELSSVIKRYSPETLIHVDASHWLGMIFGGAMENPLEAGANSFGGSTHKTFPGPQRAIVCTNDKVIAGRIQQSQFHMISSHHFGTIASLAMALLEFKEGNGCDYVNKIKDNAVALAKKLDFYGYDVRGKKYGFSNGNQIWVSTNNTGLDSYTASDRLSKIGINVNVFDELPGCNHSIMRVGVNEVTRFGALEKDMDTLAEIFHLAINQKESVEQLRIRVKRLKDGLNNYYGINSLSLEVKEKLKSTIDNIIFGSNFGGNEDESDTRF